MSKHEPEGQMDLFAALRTSPPASKPKPPPVPEPEVEPAEAPVPVEEIPFEPDPETIEDPEPPLAVENPRETTTAAEPAKDEAPTLFGDLDQFASWYAEWVGMPEFVQEDIGPWKSLMVHFESRADMEAFAKLVEQTLTYRTRSVWYPKAEIGRFSDKRYIEERKEGRS